MNSVLEHFERAKYMRALAEAHAQSLAEFPDWEIVSRFYAGLHFVQGYFVSKSQRFDAKRHDERIKAIKASPELTKSGRFLVAYRQLQEVSEQVRYDAGFKVNATHVNQARENLRLVCAVLEPKLEKLVRDDQPH